LDRWTAREGLYQGVLGFGREAEPERLKKSA
jgi:hypothetical protein